jgi:hypothetical protein
VAWDSAEAADPRITYTVQVSRDQGTTWQTIAVGRKAPDLTIDRQEFPTDNNLRVRVLATNGFRSTQVSEADIDFD